MMHPAEYDLWICAIAIGLAAVIGFTAATVSQIMDCRKTEKILEKRED